MLYMLLAVSHWVGGIVIDLPNPLTACVVVRYA